MRPDRPESPSPPPPAHADIPTLRKLAAALVEEIEGAAAAAMERMREARGQADAILMKYEAEARGVRQVLESKAAGYLSLVKGCNGDAKAAATLLMVEKIEHIVERQVEAIRRRDS